MSQPESIVVYASAVRAALAGLPEEHREVLLEDLEDHLSEIDAESGGSLEERLGTPEAYAAELRSAYGVAEVRPATPSFPKAWASVTAGVDRLTRSRSWREAARLRAELRPAWWLLRAYLFVVALAVVSGHADAVRGIPRPWHRAGLIEIGAVMVAMVISVRLGRRGVVEGRPARAGILTGNAGLGLLALPLLLTITSPPSYPPSDPGSEIVQPVYAGAPLINIFPYSSDGKPLHGVLLYDQDGNPVGVAGKGSVVPRSYPTDAAGQPITNSYPLDLVQPDGQPMPAPRVAVPPQPSPAPTPSPSHAP
ncbi:MAG: hypothetical protein QOK05_2881 [Chloroflexota bacterium]|jgi:hypothetical protein|nr:hypothetical protein [Chloroflexota bacterium]